ncbi:MAG: hypothetical protein SFU25_05995 [Candidatus Caenarcaniphilales bacterium]|nr:hypothetical protein [Candidatus Caenarcaniphilales bacterium]
MKTKNFLCIFTLVLSLTFCVNTSLQANENNTPKTNLTKEIENNLSGMCNCDYSGECAFCQLNLPGVLYFTLEGEQHDNRKIVISKKSLFQNIETEINKLKTAYKGLDTILSSPDITAEIYKQEINNVFNDATDYAAEYGGKIPLNSFPEVDKAIGIYTIDGQQGAVGDITVRIYAKKSENYILLKDALTETKNRDSLNKYQEVCSNGRNWENDSQKIQECFIQKIQADKQIQAEIKDISNKLIRTYKLNEIK